jgi:hypothetical protein
LCDPVGYFAFHGKEELADHLARMHKVIEKEVLRMKSNLRGYLCKACRKRFESWNSLRWHIDHEILYQKWYNNKEAEIKDKKKHGDA